MTTGLPELTLEGLHLQLPPGTYWLPAHLSDDDVARLLEILTVGIRQVREVRVIEWGALFGSADLPGDTLLFTEAPADGPEALEAPVYTGAGWLLVRHSKAQADLDAPWAEPLVKAPLSGWLRRWALSPTNPFTSCGIGLIPIAKLSAATTEPAELLVLVEATISHRRRHAAHGGIDAASWDRSTRWALAQRLAARLARIDDRLLPQCIDVVLTSRDGELRASGGPAWIDELTRVGLAWRSGDDLLLTPLARAVQTRNLTGPLICSLPSSAWSLQSRLRVSQASNPRTARLRPALTYPELPYHEHRFRVAPSNINTSVLRSTRHELGNHGTPSTDPVGEFLESIICQWECGRFRNPRISLLLDRRPDFTPDEHSRNPRAQTLAARTLDRAAWLAGELDRAGTELVPFAPRDTERDPDLISIDLFFWLLWAEWLDPLELSQRSLEAMILGLEQAQRSTLQVDAGLRLVIDVMIADTLALTRNYGRAIAIWEDVAETLQRPSPELSARLLFAGFRTDAAPTFDDAIDTSNFDASTVTQLEVAARSLGGTSVDVDANIRGALEDPVVPRAARYSVHVGNAEFWRLNWSADSGTTEGSRTALDTSLMLAWSHACLGMIDESLELLQAIRSAIDELGDPLLLVISSRVAIAAAWSRADEHTAARRLRELRVSEQALGLADAWTCVAELAVGAPNSRDLPLAALRAQLSPNAISTLSTSLVHELGRLLSMAGDDGLRRTAAYLVEHELEQRCYFVRDSEAPE